MKKILFAIFAHPDDEAFGPAGTLLKLKDEGYDIHLILLTDGEAGTNPDNTADLGKVRLVEWQASADILGATSTHALHYPDGTLERVDPDELDEKVDEIVAEVVDRYNEQIELSFMTFEPHGLTGHRDHIAASTLTTCVAQEFPTKQIWYFCLDSSQAPLEETAYYEPRAREDTYVTHKVDVSKYLPNVHRMIDAHVSQREDGANRKALGKERLSVECFHVER
ncbi:MAG TPA: PIG-L deacetylase family protein [Candidatus Saccharimonadales bacterium]